MFIKISILKRSPYLIDQTDQMKMQTCIMVKVHDIYNVIRCFGTELREKQQPMDKVHIKIHDKQVRRECLSHLLKIKIFLNKSVLISLVAV